MKLSPLVMSVPPFCTVTVPVLARPTSRTLLTVSFDVVPSISTEPRLP